jgi:hemerythrin-like metal-binding protein
LFSLLNHIESLGALDPPAACDDLNQAIDALITYAMDHCLHEEEVMRAAGYPEVATHAQEHAFLAEYLIEILRPAVAGEIPLATFVKLVRGRFVKHFMRDDYAFVKWLQPRLSFAPSSRASGCPIPMEMKP